MSYVKWNEPVCERHKLHDSTFHVESEIVKLIGAETKIDVASS